MVALTEVLFAVGGIVATLAQLLLQTHAKTMVAESNTWRLLMGAEALPGALMLLGALRCPESPHWLLRTGRTDEAEEVLQRVYPSRRLPDGGCDCSARDVDLSEARTALLGEEGVEPLGGDGGGGGGRGAAWLASAMGDAAGELGATCALLWSPVRPLRRAMELILLMSTMPFIGIGCIPQQFVPLLLEGPQSGHSMKHDVIDISHSTLHIDLACNVVYVLGAAATTTMLVDRVGRRGILCVTLLGSAAGFALDAATAAWPPGSHPLLVLGGVLLGYVCRAMGVGPLHQVVGSEVVPLELAARGKALYATSRRGSAMLFCLFFPPALQAVGAEAMFAGLAALTGLYTAAVWLRLPETRGYSPTEVEALLEGPAWIPFAAPQPVPRALMCGVPLSRVCTGSDLRTLRGDDAKSSRRKESL